MQLLAKFKKILHMGFRATLNFRKVKLSTVSLEEVGRSYFYFCESLFSSFHFVTYSPDLLGRPSKGINSFKLHF